MTDEITEDLKKAISDDYKKIKEQNTILQRCNELGVSEATYHKYKNHTPPLKEKPKNFGEEFKDDNKKDDEETEEDETEEDEHEEMEMVF